MPREYLADTWFFIALSDPRDSHHRNAQRLASSMPTAVIVTHDAILAEVLAYFAEDGSWARARAVRSVRHAMLTMEVVAASGQLFTKALDLYDRRTDKAYSLVDCMSMVLMSERGITHILTNDHHFRQERLNIINDAP